MINKTINKNVLNKYYSNIIRAFLALIILVAVSNRITFAQAPDAYYDWVSGYKFRTNPNNDGTMDKENYFKNVGLEPGTWQFSNYVNMMAKFPVSQENWTSTTGCRTNPQLDPSLCEGLTVGDHISQNLTFRYTCKGDVSYVLQDDNSSKDLVGGDTMYGTWSMLFNFMPPVDPTDCGADERPFVGNAYIIDTKAQKEASAGLFPGLGIKELVDSPGEVYYFDQVRALTQPPGENFDPYNNMVLVGSAVPGMESLTGCDPALFEKLFGKTSPFSYSTVTAEAKAMFDAEVKPLLEKFPELLKAYGAGQDASGNKIPCELLAGIHYNECGNRPGCSLWAGDGGLQGGSLKSDAEITAKSLVGRLNGKKDFWAYVEAVESHNGGGNKNCNDTAAGCPLTTWRSSGKCPPPLNYWNDGAYALADVNAYHSDMQLLYFANSTLGCAGDKDGPGAFAIAYILHEYLKGASTTATSCVSQY